jgi:thioredoxin 1
MLRRLFGGKFGGKPKPPTLPLEYRSQLSTIPDAGNSASTLSTRPVARDVAQNVAQDVTDNTFEQVVLRSERLAVVDFWAEWCQPCEIISVYTAWLARDYGAQVLVAALDVDENPMTPEQYTIMGLPTLIFFRNGIEIDRQVGLLSYEELQAKTDALLAQEAS